MDTTRTYIIGALLAVAVVSLVVYTLWSRHVAPQAVSGPMVVHHSVDGEEHVFSGEISLPVCDALATEVTTAGPAFSLALITSHIPSCSQEGTAPQTYSGSFMLEGRTPEFTQLMLNGAVMSFTIVED